MSIHYHLGNMMASRVNLNWPLIGMLTWLWLLSTVTAARTFSAIPGSTFSVPRIKNPQYSPGNKTLTADEVLEAYAAPFLKHNMTMPAKLLKALNKSNVEKAARALGGRQTAEVQGNNLASNGE